MSAPEGELFDLIVVGGGPGGSTLASFVAMRGHRVLLLERERFPRHQIGESLLPATVHGICRMLGLEDELAAAGFPCKLGGTFRWGSNPGLWPFRFRDSPVLETSGADYAYQVERARFDTLLLDNARLKGVDVREQHAVSGVVLEDGRVVGARYTDPDGRPGVARARFVADASGNTSQLYRQVGRRVYSRFFQNVALYCYFEGGGRHAAQLRDGYEEAMRRFIAACPTVRELLGSARRITGGMYGQLRVRKDWSYTMARFWRPGLVLIGDAACFIDPVLSSGVHLSTYSALLAARSINTCLRDGLDEERSFAEFERRYRLEFRAFHSLLVHLYDTHQDETSYFWKARNLLKTQEQANQAFARLVAGGATNAELFFPARASKGDLLSDLDAGTERPARTPLFPGGLVPSDDRLGWAS